MNLFIPSIIKRQNKNNNIIYSTGIPYPEEKLKKLISVLLAALLVISFGCGNKADSLKWYDNLESAESAAQKEGKPILIDFTGSDWCIWCKRLSNEVFTKDEFINYAKENLVLVKIDFPENIPQSAETKFYNNQLAQRFGIQGYPTIVLMDSKGNVLGVTGYQPGGPEAYIQHIKSYL